LEMPAGDSTAKLNRGIQQLVNLLFRHAQQITQS
jgi:hypothetical protein